MSDRQIAVMVVDPGGSTGYTQAIIDDTDSIQHRLGTAEVKSSTITGHWTEQAAALAGLWRGFSNEYDDMPCYLVVEDFVLIKFRSSDREGLYPVWIAGCLAGHLAVSQPRLKITWQLPSCMTYATDDRLKDWGLWAKGKVHERAANRHLAYFIANDKAQKMRNARSRTRMHV